MNSRDFENFVDELLENDFEYDDIVRVAKESGPIDRFDADKLLPDFCSMRYRFTFMYLAVGIINLITRPKKTHEISIKHLRKARFLLGSLISCMEDVHARAEKGREAEEEKGKESEGGEGLGEDEV